LRKIVIRTFRLVKNNILVDKSSAIFVRFRFELNLEKA